MYLGQIDFQLVASIEKPHSIRELARQPCPRSPRAAELRYSEAQFKTLKYRPGFPARFDSIEHARAFCREFFAWYNHEHRHSGIGLMTPDAVHHGRADAIHADRARVLADAYAATPERFVRRPPRPPALPTAAWINKPDDERAAAH